MPRSTASATMLLANDWLLFITTIPANPTMESSSPVFPSFLLGMGFRTVSSALATGPKISLEAARPAAAVVPVIRKFRLSIAYLRRKYINPEIARQPRSPPPL